ncbi:MAG: hypothetical protein K9N34_03695 [Candidatus Marinimicrobia bacterium]|nr:hypothetical protein [Candidatus Neomarinimicrobiota bacterium]
MPGLDTINLGTAGTPSGDTVRAAFNKTNNNFNYLDGYKVQGEASQDFSQVTGLTIIMGGDSKPHLKISTASDGDFTIGPLDTK